MVPAPDRTTGLRIGLFGGTFDPPHVGHVTVARDVADALSLDRMLWMPAGIPPHKPSVKVTPASLRLEMVEAAALSDARFSVSDLELMRRGPSFTVDTLRALRDDDAAAELFLVIGADQLRVFDTGWKDPEEILRLATLAVMDRDGEDARSVAPDLPGMEGLRHVPVTRVDLSSSAVREAVATGSDVTRMLPEAVLAVIRREGLYREPT
jgi:nicotinate-nucleotide adenylyltransferase